MQKIICSLLLTLCLSTRCFARLGETEVQCIERYGNALKIMEAGEGGMDYKTMLFMKNGYMVSTEFIATRCAFLMFQKTDNSAFSDTEIETLLAANVESQKWTKSNELTVKPLWIRDDGAQVQYDPFQHCLIFLSKDYIAAENAKEKAEEAKKLQGF